MYFKTLRLKKLLLCSILFYSSFCFGQDDRYKAIESKLNELSVAVPSLKERASISLSGSTLHEFIRAIAQIYKLNINVDSDLNQKIVNNFSDETVINILVFLAKQYNLDFEFIGDIIVITQHYEIPLPPQPKSINIIYDTATNLITLDLKDDTLFNVSRKITQLSNINIAILPGLSGKTVSGYFLNLNVESALEKLAAINQLKISKTNDNAFIIEPLNPNEHLVTKKAPITNSNFAIQTVTNNQNGSQNNSIQANEENGKKIISLNVINSPIKDIIKIISEQAGVNYFIYSEIVGNMTANVNNMEFEEALKKLLLGTNFTFSVNNGIYMIGDRNYEGLRSHKLIQLQYRSVDSLLYMIPDEFKRNVTIKEFKELNSFLISGSEPQINEIDNFVHQIDKKVPMVTIEVIIMDVRKGTSTSTGIKLGISDSVKTGGTILGGLDFTFGSGDINRFIDRIGLNNVFNIGHVAPNFYAQLSALETNNNVELRQTPKLSTLNGHSATLSIGSTRYYAVSTQNVIGSLNPSTLVTQQFIPIEANMAIDIVPFVSGDDNVTLNIGVNISDFTQETPINQPPPTSTSKFHSIIRIKNEEMVLLGGIERTEKSETGSGTPFLSRIPILKWLFSSKTKSNNKVVSIVFIRPTIIF